MRFEHLIEINTADGGGLVPTPPVPPFTREELWRGLMVRVYEPQSLPLGPDACDWSDEPGELLPTGRDDGAGRRDGGTGAPRAVERVRRHLRFGSLELHDRVWMEPMRRIVFTPDDRDGEPTVVLTLTIEEPHAGLLWLRFVYESTRLLTPEEAFYDEFRHNAWLANDRDMVRTLRVWLSQGRLSPPGVQ